jgi:hypothetical protein
MSLKSKISEIPTGMSMHISEHVCACTYNNRNTFRIQKRLTLTTWENYWTWWIHLYYKSGAPGRSAEYLVFSSHLKSCLCTLQVKSSAPWNSGSRHTVIWFIFVILVPSPHKIHGHCPMSMVEKMNLSSSFPGRFPGKTCFLSMITSLGPHDV